VNTDIDRLVASIAPEPGPGMTPGARELLDEITTATAADPRAPAPRRAAKAWRRRLLGAGPRSRWRVVMPLAAVAILLSWVVPDGLGIGARPASATLDIREKGDFYVITVKDLYADPERYQRELASRGLKVAIRLVPTDPRREGMLFSVVAEDPATRWNKGTHVIPDSDDIFALVGKGPCEGPLRCQVGVKIRIGYKGPGEIVLGRRARSGEDYQAPPSLMSPGQPLHCVDFVNDRVPHVLRLLTKRGVHKVTFTTYAGPRRSVPDSWYVHDGVMSSADRALILVDPTPHPHPVNVAEACRW
jgi:hypothetical protein